MTFLLCCCCVVDDDDSHIQRIVLATEETTLTQQVSHRLIKCQSRLWSQRGTKVNGSHHGDNPLLRPTGIQIATKKYAALQAMAPINIKTVHQASLLHIESNLDRLGMLSPTHDQRSQQKNGKLRSNQFCNHPGWYVRQSDVQNKWDENTQTMDNTILMLRYCRYCRYFRCVSDVE